MTPDAAPRLSRGPVRPGERALAPDLARGAMLLVIALANVTGVVFAGEPGLDPAPEGLDRGLTFLLFDLAHARGYPVFAVMFGYGLVQLARRQDASGATPRQVRAVLVRRNLWLVVFGLVHGTLLYYGDFLGAYGIVGLVMTLVLLRRSDKFHRIALVVWAVAAVEIVVLSVVVVLGWSGGAAALPVGHVASLAAPDYPTSLVDRLAEWPVHTATALPFVLISWLGVWAARRRVLEEPARHRVLLRWTAVVGIAVSVAGGLPAAVIAAGWARVDESTASLALLLHGGSGMFAGPGYVAVFGLIARHGPVVHALAALGRRSLSGYLAQSVAWLVLFAPFLLDLDFGSRTVTGLVAAVVVWQTTVLAARALGDRPGPAETVLRRLTYRR
ncbi:hypothetical protein SUDANB95_03409 [Actinosynnema sp. ALI-1.44]